MTATFQLDPLRRLGDGGHSSVLLGRETKTGEKVAVKVFRQNDNGRLLFENEAMILEALPCHPNLIRFVGATESDQMRCIAMECFPQPSLGSFVQKRGPLLEDLALHIIQQLIIVVHFLHQHRVAHRDIKPENILIHSESAQIKLIDFGLSSFIAGPHDEDDFFVGTPIYMPPQLLKKGSQYNIVAADVWSIGVSLLELLEGANPLRIAKTDNEVLELMPRLLKYDHLPRTCRKLLRGLLEIHELKRMTLIDASLILVERSERKTTLGPSPLKTRGHRRSKSKS